MLTKVCTKQPKYGKGFGSDLVVSQNLPDEISFYLKDKKLFVRSEDDHIPFSNNERSMRLCDIMAVNTRTAQVSFIEAKDNCRMVFYDATGQPKRYIDNRLLRMGNVENSYIIFRDNWQFVNSRADRRNINTDTIIEKMLIEKVVEIVNGEVHFIPYGNKLSELMKEENRRLDLEDRIPCRFPSYDGEKQYIWRSSAMKPITNLIEDCML